MVLWDKEQAHKDVLLMKRGDKTAENRVGSYILTMYHTIKHKPSWIKYSGVIEEMLRTHALVNMSKAIYKWNPEKASLYTYLQYVCGSAFLNAIKEYKNKKLKFALHSNSLNEDQYGTTELESDIA